MSFREAYVPPVRQSAQQQQAAGNHGGSRTPSFSQQEGSAVPANGAKDKEEEEEEEEEEDDTRILYQSKTRRTNIVSPSQAAASLSQPQGLPFRPRVNPGRAAYATPDEKIYYICGSCNLLSGFKSNDMLRCLNCGGMTMFKPRVKKVLQYSTN
ncbi:uncharacterized protein P884DRAFT_310487 [Thermothelomyces heterothallicus CBS 202.75]|uniref:uncharacterized protein n=1 Tax=Thermothelomyces heterothallicus CBS 202.75 TaxID=1149848 RepID=UPI0037423BC5